MNTKHLLPTVSLLVLLVVAGCSSPSLYGLEGLDRSPFDTELVGTWKEEQDAKVVYRVARGNSDTYDIVVYVEEDDETKSVHLQGVLVELDGGEILDVMLAKEEVDDLGERYALLVLPVHQFIRVQRADDGYHVSMLSPGWVKDLPGTVHPQEYAVLVTPPEQLVRLLEAALRDEDAWTDSALLQRVD